MNMENKENSKWLFGEVFVPNELIMNGYTARSIDEKFVTHEKWNVEFDLNEDRLFENPDNLLYHPVKGQFKNRIEKLNKERKDLHNRINELKAKRAKIKFNFLQRIFSAQNSYYHNKKHKIISILGIKIKIRCK